jgi:hypothetical protein
VRDRVVTCRANEVVPDVVSVSRDRGRAHESACSSFVVGVEATLP